VGFAVCCISAAPAHSDANSISASLAIDINQQADAHQGELPMADRLLVRKAERRLYLLRQGRVLRSYAIHLGLQPQGRKEFEGDYRTPEGNYFLGSRNSTSRYFLAIQVTYPNAYDEAHARHMGKRPGGAIMIHGLPNNPGKPLDYYNRADWTDGCIAVNNSDMVEIWLMTASGTPIDIEP
ncbi:MAG: L,D-transpeptidase family protein, partial [Steroidobacter sp.]